MITVEMLKEGFELDLLHVDEDESGQGFRFGDDEFFIDFLDDDGYTFESREDIKDFTLDELAKFAYNGLRAAMDDFIIGGNLITYEEWENFLVENGAVAEEPVKYYVGSCCAEEDSFFVVALTDKEFEGVKKFVGAQNNVVSGGGYCGSFGIYDNAFDTEEEARLYICDIC